MNPGSASYSIATGQVSATSTAGTLIAARPRRRSVVFFNIGASDAYVGPATVTAANGFLIRPGGALTMNSAALAQVITATGTTTTVCYMEEYD